MCRANACSTGCGIPCAFGTLTPKYAIFARTCGLASFFSSPSTRARVQPPAARLGETRLEGFFGVEKDCDRAFINQFHGHHGLKNSCGYADSQPAQRCIKLLIQCRGFVWWRRGNKAGPPLPARITVQRKLRNDQRGALNLQQRPVHLALVVLENP